MIQKRKRIGTLLLSLALLSGLPETSVYAESPLAVQSEDSACAESPPPVQSEVSVYAESPLAGQPETAGPQIDSGLCEHHPAHDAACGYAEAAEGHACEHEHLPECYSDRLACGIGEEGAKTVSGSDAVHRHGPECYEVECLHERGEHDAACGYAEPVEGSACLFVCTECGRSGKDSGAAESVSENGLPAEEETDTALAEGAAACTVMDFDILEETVQFQTVPTGTKLESLNLPAALGVSVCAAADDTGSAPEPEAITVTGVTWEPDNPWDETAEQGGCLFTPVLPAGYALSEGVELPEINVLIGGTPAALDMQNNGIQNDVLTVIFDDNGTGGVSSDDNDMKTAIDAALAALPPGSQETVTTIRLTGRATEITGYNWGYLIGQYGRDDLWGRDCLTTLDLSGLTSLETIKRNFMGGHFFLLKTLRFPDSLKEVGKSSFDGCTSLAQTELPEGVSEIGERAFASCRRLVLAELPESVSKIGEEAFAGCQSLALTELPEGVTEIGDDAFVSCWSLALTELPEGVTEIGDDTFGGCYSLALTELPVGVAEIGERAFFGCSSLALKELPEGVTEIGERAFEGCSSLALTELPSGLTHISDGSFNACANLALTELPAGVTEIGNWAFIDCKNLALTELPAGVTEIRWRAFDGCTNLALTELPAGVTRIGLAAFRDCTSLTLSKLPAGLTHIWGDTFKDCTSLTLIELPPSVIHIVFNSFAGCTSLERIIMKSKTAPSMSWDTFTNLNPGLTFYVPEDGTGYDSGGWENLNTVKYSPPAAVTYQDTAETQPEQRPVTLPSDNARPPKPDPPALAVIEISAPAENGTAAGQADDGLTAAALSEAQRDVRAGSNGIAVQYDAKIPVACGGFSITVKRATLDRLIAAKVKYVALNTGIVDFTFDLPALQEIQKQSAGDIALTAARETGLTGDALAAVAARPAYRLAVGYNGLDGKPATVESFGAGRVIVGVACRPSAGQAGSLFLVHSRDKKSAEWLYQSSYDRNSGNVICATGHFSIYGVGCKPAPVFTDTADHWAKADIDFAASRDLLAGTGGTAFTPEGSMTRAMLAVALGRLAGLDPAACPSGRFTDIAANTGYAPYAEWVVSRGIMDGTGEETFSPEVTVTRGQMAVIMQRYADSLGYVLPVAYEAETFADERQIAGGMKKAVQDIQQAGVMYSKGGHRFGPEDTATRAEAAAMLRRFAEIVIVRSPAGGWAQNDVGSWLYYGNNKPVTGWRQVEGSWYYFYPDGGMAADTAIDGFRIGPDGKRKE